MTTNRADEWLTGKEAAAVLKLTVRTIEKIRTAGRLPYWKSDTGSVRYRRQHVEALLKPAAVATVTVAGKSWTAVRITPDASELPEQIRREPSRRAA